MKLVLTIEYAFVPSAYDAQEIGYDVTSVEDAIQADTDFFGTEPETDFADFVEWLKQSDIPFATSVEVSK